PVLLIDVVGVGYEVYASMNTFYKLPEIGKEVTLYTHLIVREDVHDLYAFFDLRERSLFRTLIKVNGVGPRMAMAILSSIDPDEFVFCVESGDAARLTHIPGVGKKTAERLIVEMRDRLKDWRIANDSNKAAMQGVTSSMDINSATRDAISALVALGYKPQDASRAVSKLDAAELTSEEIIRQALKQI
ncbi:MAG: Holliday junction branch migration protein RuvA, partial [Gammaproteobacteria bacterium]